MRILRACLALLVVGCTANNDTTGDPDPIVDDPNQPSTPVDAGVPVEPADARPVDPNTPAPVGDHLPAAAACASDSQCTGGTCLGIEGGLEADNTRFAGGYCTAIGCVPNTQEGCGADEICVEAGDLLMGGYCVELCSKADGLVCDRADHVCLGLGSFGGCYSSATVECNVQEKNCPDPGDICVRIGYEDRSLGRCETRCDPLNETTCREDHSCYYIKAYNAAFCGSTGTSLPEESCVCDKCCVTDFACTPDLDTKGRHCKRYCSVENPTQCKSGEQCVPLEEGSPYGGCVAPGSAGT
jgi:hypothetical protein